MSDNKHNVKVRYSSKKREKRIKVHGKKDQPDAREIKEQSNNEEKSNKFEFDLDLGSNEGECISLMPRSDDLTPGCKIVIPSTVHYRFTPGGKERIDIMNEKGETTIKIPPGAPNWKLNLINVDTNTVTGTDNTVTGTNDTLTGTNDTVTVEEDEEGGPPDKDLLSFLEKKMSNTVRLDEFLDKMKKGTLKDRDRKRIIQQALFLIDEAYVHLPLKKAMHAVEPVQRLKLLMHRNSQLDDMTFHNHMISIFTGLRDIHTIYSLPDAYKNKVAFLPFMIEEFYDEEEKKYKYMVSKIFKAVKTEETGENLDASFEEGVILTHWNGVPIKDAIALNGERNAGSNEYARHARGLERMTIRPLKMTLPPDEHWVDIDYLEKGSNQSCNRRFKWYVADIPRRRKGAVESREDAVQTALGVDVETEMTLRVKRSLFRTIKSEKKEKMEMLRDGGEKYLEWNDKKKDRLCAFSMVSIKKPGSNSGESEKFGYFRIYSFNVKDADYFVKIFIQHIKPKLQEENTKGLIIDVRGNGGGLITAGERLLQVLTPKKIEPERFQFINSPLMLQLCQKKENKHLGLDRWKDSISGSIETGAVYSQGFPLDRHNSETGKNMKEEIERVKNYDDPIVLVTDALCYSTTDIFAAGFKDNKIGKILGVHKKTGAGGANVWSHKLLRKLLPGGTHIKPLPQGCEFTVAIRRSTRVGENIGLPLEDLGVDADYPHKMTKNDLQYCNIDLIKEAAEVLDIIRKEKENEVTK